MKKTRAMIFFLLLTAAVFYAPPLLAFNVSSTYVFLFVSIPTVTFGLSLIYSIINGFHILYPVLAGATFFLVPVYFFELSKITSLKLAGAAALVVLTGNIAGTLIYAIVNKITGVSKFKKQKKTSGRPERIHSSAAEDSTLHDHASAESPKLNPSIQARRSPDFYRRNNDRSDCIDNFDSDNYGL